MNLCSSACTNGCGGCLNTHEQSGYWRCVGAASKAPASMPMAARQQTTVLVVHPHRRRRRFPFPNEQLFSVKKAGSPTWLPLTSQHGIDAVAICTRSRFPRWKQRRHKTRSLVKADSQIMILQTERIVCMIHKSCAFKEQALDRCIP
jgi:hypothetical protein